VGGTYSGQDWSYDGFGRGDDSPTEKLRKSRGFGVFLLVWSGVGDFGVYLKFLGNFFENYSG